MRSRANAKILSLYARFNGEKSAKLSSCKRSNKCRDIQRTIIFFSLQRSQNSTEQQLLQLLIISSLYALIDSVYELKCLSQVSARLLFIQLVELTQITQSRRRSQNQLEIRTLLVKIKKSRTRFLVALTAYTSVAYLQLLGQSFFAFLSFSVPVTTSYNNILPIKKLDLLKLYMLLSIILYFAFVF